MYRECAVCKDLRVPFQPYEQTDQTIWEEWRVVDHEYVNKSTRKIEKTKRVQKVKIEGTVDGLDDRFEENVVRKLARHVFNIRHQYQQLKLKKESLAQNEMLMHIDFSENYTLKYHSEIQSCHFGASNQQVTLHTGMLYTQKESQGFASVSGCRRHDASAIWAHLKPPVSISGRETPRGRHGLLHLGWTYNPIPVQDQLLSDVNSPLRLGYEMYQLVIFRSRPREGRSRWNWGRPETHSRSA
jgi:hypothetical protein